MQVQEKLLDEFRNVLGEGGQITYENQAKLVYTDQVINETSR